MFHFKIDQLKTTNSLKSLALRAQMNTLSKSNSDLRLSHMSTSSIEKLDEQFCGAFQEHYEYLMDKGLIETCQFSGSQLFQNDYENMSGNVSFKEFLHQYNELKRWLEQMQFSYSDSMSSFCEKYTNQIFYEEILKRSPRRELLNEYACHLVKYHPHLKHDVLSKLNYLNKQWKSIEFSIISKRFQNEDITKDLEEDLKNFELWLIKVESIVENLTLNTKWNIDEITKKLSDHKCLQSDIESHARIINSVLKLSTKLKQTCIDCTRFYENGLFLQNRWHCLWLKSLEWQCRLEQELARKKKVSIDLEELVDKNTKLQQNNETTTTTITRDLIKFNENNIKNKRNKSTSRLNLNKEQIETFQDPLFSSSSSSSTTNNTNNSLNNFLIKKQKTTLNSNSNSQQQREDLEKEQQSQDQQNSPNNSTQFNTTNSISSSGSSNSSSSEYLLNSISNQRAQRKNTFVFGQEFNFFKITHSLSSSFLSSSSSSSSSSFGLNTSSGSNHTTSSTNSTTNTNNKNTITHSNHTSNNQIIRRDDFIQRKYNYLRVDYANRNHQLKNYLNKELKKYLEDLKKSKNSSSSSRGSSSNNNTDDVIPFDECEYEKINLSPQTISHTLIVENPTKQLQNKSASIFLLKKQRKIPLKSGLISKSLSFLQSFKQYQVKQEQMYQEEIKTMSENNLILNNSVESHDSGGCSSGSESVSTGSEHKQQLLSDHNINENIKVNLNLDEMNRLTLSTDLNKTESTELIYRNAAEQTQNGLNSSLTALTTSFRRTRRRTAIHKRSHKKTRSNSSALCNDLSYYYSLTDVKYYNIDDNEDENVLTQSSSASSLSSSLSNSLGSSLSTSLSLSLSKSSSSSSSSLARVNKTTATRKLKTRNHLQKSITLPNANEMANLALIKTNRIVLNKNSAKFSTPQPTQTELSITGSSSSLSSNNHNTSSDIYEKTDKLSDTNNNTNSNNNKKNSLYKKYNKSFSDYCMSATSSSNRIEQQRRQRIIRYLKNSHYHVIDESKHDSRAKHSKTHNKCDDYDQNDYEDNDMDSDSCLINKKRYRYLKQSSTSFLNSIPSQLKKSKCYLCLSNINNTTTNNNNNTTMSTNLTNATNLTTTSKRLKRSAGNEADCDEYDDDYDENNSTNEINDDYVEDYNFDDQIEADTNQMTTTNASCSAIDSCFFKCKLTSANVSPTTTVTISSNTIQQQQQQQQETITVANESINESKPNDSNQLNNETVIYKSNATTNTTANTNTNLVASVVAIDETSTANTDVSDPHWDGFTSSPYYNTSVTLDEICFNEKTQPILPWDELFFELEPIDDVPLKNNNGKKSRSKRNVNLNNLNLTHNHYYHHYHHNQKLIHYDFKNQKCNKCTCTNQTNQLAQQQQQQQQIIRQTNQHHQLATSVNYYYLKKLNRNSANCSSTDSSSNNFSGFSLNESLSSESCVSNSHTAIQPHSPSPAAAAEHNSKLKHTTATKQWNTFDAQDMEDLVNILNDSLSQWDFSYNLFVKLKSNQSESSHKLKVGTFENLDFYSMKSSLDLVKYSEILAACQTNINCLASIKNSIIDYKMNRQLKNKELAADEDDYNNIDFYLPKLDETIIKWKMLESLCIEDNRCLMNFNNLIDELKPLKNKIEYISNLSKQTIFFESIEDLKIKLNNLEENCLTLSELLNRINLKKEKYKSFTSSSSSSSSNTNDSDTGLFTDEIACIEELHKITSISVKVKINTFEKILNLWLKTEEILKSLKTTLSNLKHNQSEQLIEEYNTEVNQFENSLALFKKELVSSNCLSLNSIITDVYESYLAQMEQFKFELTYFNKIQNDRMQVKQDVKLKYNSNKSETEHNKKCLDPNCENFKKSANFNFKTSAEHHYENTNENIMTNIHLDFHMNDSIDENNFQMTSTPRYNHKKESLLQTKTYCDKSMATVDDKSIQTDFNDSKPPKLMNRTANEPRLSQSTDFKSKQLKEINKNLNTHRSLDSGIMCGLDNTTQSLGLGSFASSSSSPLSYSFDQKNHSGDLIMHEKEANTIQADASTNTDAPLVELTETPLNVELNVNEKKVKLNEEVYVRKRLINHSFNELDTIVTSSAENNEPEAKCQDTFSSDLNDINNELENNQDAIDISKKETSFNYLRLLKYFFMFMFIICLFVFMIMPRLIPTCCDFKKEFLIFNEKNFNYDDTPLPF